MQLRNLPAGQVLEKASSDTQEKLGCSGRVVDTHVVGIVILIVGQLDHTIGALEKGRCL